MRLLQVNPKLRSGRRSPIAFNPGESLEEQGRLNSEKRQRSPLQPD
ncbi:hypothetical protein NYE70_18115 [Paenibacillus sp. FSL R5-0407]